MQGITRAEAAAAIKAVIDFNGLKDERPTMERCRKISVFLGNFFMVYVTTLFVETVWKEYQQEGKNND